MSGDVQDVCHTPGCHLSRKQRGVQLDGYCLAADAHNGWIADAVVESRSSCNK